MPFLNRIRLPFYLRRPQFVEDREVFTKADGDIKTLSVVIKKQYEGDTELWPEKIHERFKIALAHDHVSVEGDRYVGAISQEGDYTIEWPDYLDYPIAKAAFKANVTPYDASNSNCGTCDEFTQVVTEDDDIGIVGEDETVSVAVTDNDAICCYPFELTITSINSDLVASAVVNGLNIDVTTKTPLTSQNDAVLVTYRVTCDNDQYDEADIIADIDGSIEPECNQPSFLDAGLGADGPGTAAPNWDVPTPTPVGYNYSLYLLPDEVTPIDTGTTTDTSILYADLEPGDYKFVLIADCGDGNFAAPLEVEFTIGEVSEGCGQYRLQPIGHGSSGMVTYMNCSGEFVTVNVTLPQRIICALENSPGDPVSISGPASISVTYLSPCE